ncbi:hypothetical protein M3Y98_00924700 [Aphelenchoides besseyi]|nr:hypothetical protein M3Y98_00924700 [Aphelenchoides besseyi]
MSSLALQSTSWTQTVNALFLILFAFVVSQNSEEQSTACAQNPQLSFCRDNEIRRAPVKGKKANKDKKACKVLQDEFEQNCKDVKPKEQDEFCSAYKNVCLQDDPQPTTEPTTTAERPATTTESSDNSTRQDYHEFCKSYNQRFQYVCPDPIRFGPRAAVFCPIYSERCNLTPPERPVVPKPSTRSPVFRMCGQYQRFASSYCGNQFALQFGQIREGCMKYQQFCSMGMRRVVGK